MRFICKIIGHKFKRAKFKDSLKWSPPIGSHPFQKRIFYYSGFEGKCCRCGSIIDLGKQIDLPVDYPSPPDGIEVWWHEGIPSQHVEGPFTIHSESGKMEIN